jgi:hypothetical protein
MQWKLAKNKINSKYRDHHGLITYLDGNGGDTCQMIAFYYYGLFIHGECDLLHFILDFHKIMPKSGIFIRHPDRAPGWDQPGQRDIARWNDPAVLSRDQLMPMVIALGIYGVTFHLNETLKNIKSRVYRSQNGDLILLAHWAACFIRAPRLKYMYPVLFLTDLFLVIGAIIDLVKARIKPQSGKGYKNAFMLISQAYEVMPTPISWLARKIYKLRAGGLLGGYQAAYSAWDDPCFPDFFEEYITKIS